MKKIRRLPLLTAATLQFTSRIGMGLLLQFRMRELGAPLFLVSLVSSIRGGTSSLMSPVWGSISDKKRKRKLFLILSSVGTALSISLYLVSSSPLSILFVAALVAVFSSGFNPVAMALSTEYSRKKNSQARELSFLNSSNSLGMLIGRLLVGALLVYFSVKESMFFLVALAWIAVFPVLFVRESEDSGEVRRKKRKLEDVKSTLTKNGLWAVYLSAFIRQFGISGIMSLAAIYLNEKIGIKKSSVGFISAVNPIVQTPSHIFFGRIVDRVGSKFLAASGIALTAVAALIFLFGKSILDVSLAYATLGFAFGAFMNGTAMFITKSTERWQRAGALGFLSTSRQLGAMIGPIVAGVLASFSYNLLFLTMALIMIAGSVILMVFSKEPEE